MNYQELKDFIANLTEDQLKMDVALFQFDTYELQYIDNLSVREDASIEFGLPCNQPFLVRY